MSRPGTPSDNQPIECFWRTLGCEMPDICSLTFEEASRTVVKYIELYYNSSRLVGIQQDNHIKPPIFLTGSGTDYARKALI
jgi:transposase InsO family protein